MRTYVSRSHSLSSSPHCARTSHVISHVGQMFVHSDELNYPRCYADWTVAGQRHRGGAPLAHSPLTLAGHSVLCNHCCYDSV